jgi:hypothetical protein
MRRENAKTCCSKLDRNVSQVRHCEEPTDRANVDDRRCDDLSDEASRREGGRFNGIAPPLHCPSCAPHRRRIGNLKRTRFSPIFAGMRIVWLIRERRFSHPHNFARTRLADDSWGTFAAHFQTMRHLAGDSRPLSGDGDYSNIQL